MDNFIYENHTRIIFGKDTEKTVGAECAKYDSKILLVYGGGSIKQSGLYDNVVSSLKDAGLDFVELSGVVPNPVLSLVNQGISLCRKQNIGFILAVGGGSVIDTAKAIALGVRYEGNVWDFFCDISDDQNALPVGCILTFPAAGSENSTSCVITNDELRIKKGIQVARPVFSILNPELTYTLPAYQTAAGAVDILAHVMERYFTPTRDVCYTDSLCETTMKSVIEITPFLIHNPSDYSARSQIMWASTIAHNGLLSTGRVGDWAVHHIQHALSGICDMAHGAGLAAVYPSWMKYVYKHDVARFEKFALRVWDVDADFGNSHEIALEGIARYENFIKSIGMPTRLSELGITADRLTEVAEICGRDGNFVVLEVSDIEEILRLAL